MESEIPQEWKDEADKSLQRSLRYLNEAFLPRLQRCVLNPETEDYLLEDLKNSKYLWTHEHPILRMVTQYIFSDGICGDGPVENELSEEDRLKINEQIKYQKKMDNENLVRYKEPVILQKIREFNAWTRQPEVKKMIRKKFPDFPNLQAIYHESLIYLLFSRKQPARTINYIKYKFRGFYP